MFCVGNPFFTSTSTNHEGDDLTCVQGGQGLRGAITANPSDARSSSGIKTYLPTVSSKSAAKQWWVFHHQGSWPGGVTTGCCEKKRKDWFWGCLVTEESIAPRPMICPGEGGGGGSVYVFLKPHSQRSLELRSPQTRTKRYAGGH